MLSECYTLRQSLPPFYFWFSVYFYKYTAFKHSSAIVLSTSDKSEHAKVSLTIYLKRLKQKTFGIVCNVLKRERTMHLPLSSSLNELTPLRVYPIACSVILPNRGGIENTHQPISSQAVASSHLSLICTVTQ